MNEVMLRGDKQCPHGHTRRRKCDICDREDDAKEIARLRNDLTACQLERDRLLASNLALIHVNKALADAMVESYSAPQCGDTK